MVVIMTIVTVVVIVKFFLLSPQHLANRPLSGQLFAILAMFFNARALICLPNALYLPTKQPWGAPNF